MSSIHAPVVGGLRLVVWCGQDPPSTAASTSARGAPDLVEPLARLLITWPCRADESELVVRVTGDVDLATAPTLAWALDGARRDLSQVGYLFGMVVDLHAARFLSMAGIRVLANLHDVCTKEGTALRVVADQPKVIRLLSLIGFAEPGGVDAD